MEVENYIKVILLISLTLILTTGLVNAQDTTVEEKDTCLYLFYSPSCPHCDNVEEYLSEAENNYSLNIVKYNALENSQLFKKLADKYNIPERDQGKVPTVFIGEGYCLGDVPCIDLLEQKFNEYEDKPPECPSPEVNETEKESDIHESKLTVAGVAGLAAVDAVNPCALAVLLILITTILTKYPKKKNRALKAGLLFSLSIALCYFLIGTLIVFGFKSVASISSLNLSGLYKYLGIFAIIIGILNFKDYFKHGAGGFVMEVPFSWRPKMKSIIKSATSPAGAFLVGIIVSLFLLPCTSGPYFVAGGILAGMGWFDAFPWLFLYNIIFILPMILITFGVYLGFASVESVSEWRNKNIKYLHLFAGIIIIALGIFLILYSTYPQLLPL